MHITLPIGSSTVIYWDDWESAAGTKRHNLCNRPQSVTKTRGFGWDYFGSCERSARIIQQKLITTKDISPKNNRRSPLNFLKENDQNQ